MYVRISKVVKRDCTTSALITSPILTSYDARLNFLNNTSLQNEVEDESNSGVEPGEHHKKDPEGGGRVPDKQGHDHERRERVSIQTDVLLNRVYLCVGSLPAPEHLCPEVHRERNEEQEAVHQGDHIP